MKDKMPIKVDTFCVECKNCTERIVHHIPKPDSEDKEAWLKYASCPIAEKRAIVYVNARPEAQEHIALLTDNKGNLDPTQIFADEEMAAFIQREMRRMNRDYQCQHFIAMHIWNSPKELGYV